MTIDSVPQYGPITAAYLAGAGSGWAFFIKWLLPSELKAVAVQIELLKKQNAELKTEVEEYRDLMKEALADKLEGGGG